MQYVLRHSQTSFAKYLYIYLLNIYTSIVPFAKSRLLYIFSHISRSYLPIYRSTRTHTKVGSYIYPIYILYILYIFYIYEKTRLPCIFSLYMQLPSRYVLLCSIRRSWFLCIFSHLMNLYCASRKSRLLYICSQVHLPNMYYCVLATFLYMYSASRKSRRPITLPI